MGLFDPIKKVVRTVAHAVGDVAQGAKHIGGGIANATKKVAGQGANAVRDGFIDAVTTPYPNGTNAKAKRNGELERKMRELRPGWTPSARTAFDDIKRQGLSNTDIGHGSHVMMKDGGALYEKWSKLATAEKRTSSHHKDGIGQPSELNKDGKVQQYEIDFKGMGTLLFGKDKNGNTWFQFEKHGAAGNKVDAAKHGLDYLLHKGSGNQNVGPFGVSPHSEKTGKELVLPYKP